MSVKVLCQFIDEKGDHYGYVVRRSFDWMPAQGDWLEFSSTRGVRRGRVVGDRTYDSEGCAIIDVVLGGFESPCKSDYNLIGIMWQPPAERLGLEHAGPPLIKAVEPIKAVGTATKPPTWPARQKEETP